MTIDTKTLRDLRRAITPLPWTVAEEAFDNNGHPESVIRGMQGRVGVAVTLDFGKNNPGMREVNAAWIVAACNSMPGLLDHIDAQAAEITRQRQQIVLSSESLLEHDRAWNRMRAEQELLREMIRNMIETDGSLRAKIVQLRMYLAQTLTSLEACQADHRNGETARVIAVVRAALQEDTP